MSEVGIRALKQNASAVIARAAQGESLEVTDRGRPVARIVPLRASRFEELLTEGRLRPARMSRDEYLTRRAGHAANRSSRSEAIAAPDRTASEALQELRAERL